MKPEPFTLGNLQKAIESFTPASLCSHARACPRVAHSLINPPPPPALLPPLAHCLVRSTIVYSVPSRASGDTPKAKAAAHGESAGQRPSERDTGSILVWDPASARGGSVRPARNSHGDFVVFAICRSIVKSILHHRKPCRLWL